MRFWSTLYIMSYSICSVKGIFNQKRLYTSSSSTQLKALFRISPEEKKNLPPLCINCKHFIQDISNYPYDNPPNDSKYGLCRNFGDIDLVTGEKKYNYASTTREFDHLCGKKGKYWELQSNSTDDNKKGSQT